MNAIVKKLSIAIGLSVIIGFLGYVFFQTYLVPMNARPIYPNDSMFFSIFIAVDAFFLILVALMDFGEEE
jgi:hypothetical protein